jgi:hypothetical protein
MGFRHHMRGGIAALVMTLASHSTPAYDQDNGSNLPQSEPPVQAKVADEASTMPEPIEDGFLASYGEEKDSLFFVPKAFEQYLYIIGVLEKEGPSPSAAEGAAAENGIGSDTIKNILGAAGVDQKQPDPIVYPAYHLGSILYRSGMDWMVTINGVSLKRSTNKVDNELFVSALQPNRVTLIWRPQDPRLLQDLKKRAGKAANARNKALDHRRVTRTYGLPSFNADKTAILFTLEPNQLFYSQHLTVYEGGQEGIVPPPPTFTDNAVLPASSTPATPPAAAIPNAAPIAPSAPMAAATPIAAPAPAAPVAAAPVANQQSAAPANTEKPKKRNALNSFSASPQAMPVPVTPAAPILPLTPQPTAPLPTIAPAQAIVPSAVPAQNANELPLDQLPSIESIVP